MKKSLKLSSGIELTVQDINKLAEIFLELAETPEFIDKLEDKFAMANSRNEWKMSIHRNIIGAMENWFFIRLAEKCGFEILPETLQKWQSDVSNHLRMFGDEYYGPTKASFDRRKAMPEHLENIGRNIRGKMSEATKKLIEIGSEMIPVRIPDQPLDMADFAMFEQLLWDRVNTYYDNVTEDDT